MTFGNYIQLFYSNYGEIYKPYIIPHFSTIVLFERKFFWLLASFTILGMADLTSPWVLVGTGLYFYFFCLVSDQLVASLKTNIFWNFLFAMHFFVRSSTICVFWSCKLLYLPQWEATKITEIGDCKPEMGQFWGLVHKIRHVNSW